MKADVIFLVIVLAWTTSGALAQSTGPGQTPPPPRVTPLGTQRPKSDPSSQSDKKTGQDKKEKPEDAIERAVAAHGGRQARTSVRDSVSEGKLTYFAPKGARNTVEVTVIRQGNSRVQRVLNQGDGELRQGSDGTSTWESFNGMTVLSPGGLAGNYIESETLRAVDNLFDAPAKGLPVRDAGTKGSSRALEVELPAGENSPRKTTYLIDESTSRVTGIEFVTGQARDILGRTIPATESFVFSDFRPVQGVPTPFRVERYVDGLKIEETQFTTIRHNTSVNDAVFKP